jgi:hypothetical protein
LYGKEVEGGMDRDGGMDAQGRRTGFKGTAGFGRNRRIRKAVQDEEGSGKTRGIRRKGSNEFRLLYKLKV